MYSVLIVEDEMLVRVGLRNMICWSGMDLFIAGEARNGKEGLEMYYEKKPDIILTDIKMPVVDGLEMISEIRRNDTRTVIIILSSYEEFELVNQAYKLGISDYISKLQMMPEEMEKVMQGVVLKLLENDKKNEIEKTAIMQEHSEQMVRKRILDYILNPAGQHENFQLLAKSIDICERSLLICMMELRSGKDEDNLEMKLHNDKIIYAVENLVENILRESKCGEVWIESDKRYLILLNIGAEKEKEKDSILRNLLKRIQGVVRTCVNTDSIFGISRWSDSYRELNLLYTEAVNSLEEAWFLDEEIILHGDIAIHEKYENILKNFEKCVLEIEQVSEECRKKILYDIDILGKREILNAAVIKETMIRCLHLLSFENNVYKEELTKATMEMAEHIHSARSFEEMLQILEKYANMLYQTKSNKKNLNRELSEAIVYLKMHCCEENISLPSVAQKVGLHKDYLSKLFKWELGLGFSDYVNSLRIKKAKELLKTTHMCVYEVAQTVGFRDESYFSRVFKKITGVRPNEYKRCEMIVEDITDEES